MAEMSSELTKAEYNAVVEDMTEIYTPIMSSLSHWQTSIILTATIL